MPAPAGQSGPDADALDGAGLDGAGLGNAGLASPGRTLPGWLPGLIRLAAISAAGGVLSYEVMVLLGRPIVKYGPRIDVPIMEWTHRHQVEPWAAVMERLNKIPNTWTTWGACGAAAACLAASRHTRKWLPPSVLGSSIVVDHYVTIALRRKFGRPGPPTSPLGTYPSGGCDRVVLFYGLIANLAWREFSGSQRGRVMALGAMSLLAFNAAYCREYLSKHWFTDIVTGLIYGVVLYVPFAAAIWLIDGPPARPAGLDGPDAAARLDGRASGRERQGAAAGVGEAVSARPASEHSQ